MKFSKENVLIYTQLGLKETMIQFFEDFVSEYYDDYKAELDYILSKLKAINEKVSWNNIPFKDKEGKLGDGVSEFFDLPNKKLRLFCIRYANIAVVLGGGAPKNVRAWQDNPELKRNAELLIKISKMITEALSEGYLNFNEKGFSGDLMIDDYAD